MKLQADPTTIYAITEGKYKLPRLLTHKDLMIAEPFNTYHVYGLPKSPISCPNEESIKAAIYPAITKEIYFVANGNGGHLFAETFRQHRHNIKLYKRKLARK